MHDLSITRCYSQYISRFEPYKIIKTEQMEHCHSEKNLVGTILMIMTLLGLTFDFLCGHP